MVTSRLRYKIHETSGMGTYDVEGLDLVSGTAEIDSSYRHGPEFIPCIYSGCQQRKLAGEAFCRKDFKRGHGDRAFPREFAAQRVEVNGQSSGKGNKTYQTANNSR